MTNKSNIQIAYELVESRGTAVAFNEIWDEVKKQSGMTEEECARELGRFYTNLSLDGRFVTLGENTWDLRKHHTFDKVHIDMNDVYADDDEKDLEDMDEEEKEYEQILESDEDRDEDEEDNDEDEKSSEEY